jgi:hypothetical protein
MLNPISRQSENSGPGAMSETFVCPHCQAEILAANQFIHEAVCARMRANNNGNNSNDQRVARPQQIVRQSSSSGDTYSQEAPNFMREPQIRREARRVVENKLITCPNCEKGIREQDLTFHMNYECESGDKIPCEFCDQSVPMNLYSQHVENCPTRREQEQNRQNNRPVSPGRNNERMEVEEPNPSSQEERTRAQTHTSTNERQRSPRPTSSQEPQGGPSGFMNFLFNVGNAAVNGLRNYVSGGHSHDRERENARDNRPIISQQTNPNMRHQEFPQQRPQQQMRNMNQQPRNPFMSLMNPFMQEQDDNPLIPTRRSSRGTVVRTIERGPHGTLLIRTRVVPSDRVQNMPGRLSPPQMGTNMENMGPLGMLLSLLNDGQSGMPMFLAGGQEGAVQEERGLNKEVLNDMAVVKFDKNKFKNLDHEAKTCSICLEEFEDGDELKFLWCLHRFHKKCIDQWLDKHTNCPVCKKDFSEAQGMNESNA